MNLTKAAREVAKWNETFQHIPEDDDTREYLWRYDAEHRDLALRLIEEEVKELREASTTLGDIVAKGGELCYEDVWKAPQDSYLPKANDVEVLDAIADILFTVLGLAAKAGLTDLVEPAFKEVVRSNWTKMGPDGPEFYPDGKVAKPDTYEAPDLRQFFDEEDLA